VSVLVEGDYAYLGVLDETGGNLCVIDISDLATTTICGQLNDVAQRRFGTMAVKEACLYVAESLNGVQIVNITTPEAPEVVGAVSSTYGAYDVMVYNDFLFVGCHWMGTRMFDVSTPNTPQSRGYFNDNAEDDGEALGVWAVEGYLYIADNYNVELLNISSLSNITELGEYDEISAAHDLTVQDQFVYVAAGGGLYILAFGGTHPLRPPIFLVFLIPIIIAVIGVAAGLVYRYYRTQDRSSPPS
jgi:hypothetical protein